MIIETGSAEEARDIARKLLRAARHPGDVRTVHRGSRLAFSVPDELGRAVGREPDASPAAEQTPAATDRPADQPGDDQPEGEDAGDDGGGEPPADAGEAAGDDTAPKKRSRKGS